MSLIDILFPKHCLGCGKGGGYICTRCIGKVQYAKTICPVCRRFNFYGKSHPQCLLPTSLNGLISLWEFDGVVREAIHRTKYRFAQGLVNSLGEFAAIEVQKFKISKDAYFCCVPQQMLRTNWRGFNQAEEYAKMLSLKLNIPYIPNLLVKREETKVQARLKGKERLRNIHGKIAANREVLTKINKNKTIYIVDDVWTTGTTLKECGRVLKNGGLKNVWGLTVAKV